MYLVTTVKLQGKHFHFVNVNKLPSREICNTKPIALGTSNKTIHKKAMFKNWTLSFVKMESADAGKEKISGGAISKLVS